MCFRADALMEKPSRKPKRWPAIGWCDAMTQLLVALSGSRAELTLSFLHRLDTQILFFFCGVPEYLFSFSSTSCPASPSQPPSPKDKRDFIFPQLPLYLPIKSRPKSLHSLVPHKIWIRTFTKISYLGGWEDQSHIHFYPHQLPSLPHGEEATLAIPSGTESISQSTHFGLSPDPGCLDVTLNQADTYIFTVTIWGRFDSRSVLSQWLQDCTVMVPRTWGLKASELPGIPLVESTEKSSLFQHLGWRNGLDLTVTDCYDTARSQALKNSAIYLPSQETVIKNTKGSLQKETIGVSHGA